MTRFKKSRFGTKIIRNPIQTAIIVPSTKAGNRKISRVDFDNRIDTTRKELSNLFGGNISVKSIGGYLEDRKTKDKAGKEIVKKTLIEEKGNVVESYATEKDYHNNKGKFFNYAIKKRDEWGQSEVAVIVENDLHRIQKKD